MSRGDDTMTAWRAASERADAEAAIGCLADDVVLVSPLTAQFSFQGRMQVGQVLVAALEVIGDIRFHTEVGDQATRALFYRGRCGGQAFEEAQLLRLDEQGLIRELTLFGRPLPGLTAVMSRIGPALARLDGRSRMAVFLKTATSPLHAVTVAGERYIVPMADPNRG
jgi:hypothetical protein